MRQKRRLQPIARFFATTAMMATMTMVHAQAQMRFVEITGTVQDETGEPLGRANVQVTLGKQRWPATTNQDGTFTIKVPENVVGVARIAASYIGMKRYEVALAKGKNVYTLVLRDDSNEFAEAVVTGYGTVTLREKTSSITSLKMDDVLMPGMTSLEQALEGRVPDLVFMQNSGEAGTTARLRVRGTSTLMGNREPLWVLDGIPLADPVDVTNEQLNDPDYINYIGNAISGLNPQDIERVDVLKDAAATALYGTRAANGVIVVTTKKGEMGPPRFSYNGQYKYTARLRYSDGNINLMNSKERVEFGKDLVDLHYSFPSNMTMVGFEGAYYRYINGELSYDQFVAEAQRAETTNTDWFKLLTRDTFNHNHTLSVSGGGETARYYASLGYNKENGTVRGHDNNRYTASLNLQTKVADILTANIRLNASVQKREQLPGDVDALGYAYNTTRALPSHHADGSYYYYQRHAYRNSKKNDTYKYRYNILNEMENAEQTYEADNLMAALDLTYRYKSLLDVTFTTSYQRTTSSTSKWFGERSHYVALLKNGEVEAQPIPGDYGLSELPYGGLQDMTHRVNSSFVARLQANLRHSWGPKRVHMASVSLGYELNTNNTNGNDTYTRGYFRSRGMQYVTMNGDDLKQFPHYLSWVAANRPKLVADKTNRLSGYAILSYSYGNKFSVSANGRFDASNKFGSRSNEKFLPVWSLSTMINIKDLWLKDYKWVSDARLRSSYGKTGNMVDNQTPNLLLRQGSIDTYYGENVSTVHALPNPNLRWEQTDQFNLGLEASFFDYRLTVGLEAYSKYTHDAFNTVPVSPTNGVSNYVLNGSDIHNRGYSIQLSGYPIQNRDWSWYLSTNYSFVKNRIEVKAENDYSKEQYLDGTAIINGKSVGSFYAYKFLGLNPENGTPIFDDYYDRRHLLEGKTLRGIMEMVAVHVGSREPYLNGSVYSTLRYKQLSVRTNFVYSLGSKIRRFGLYGDILDGVSSENNVRKEFVERWRVPGDEHRTNYPALISPSSPEFGAHRYHWSVTTAGLKEAPFKAFADNHWKMYDLSDVRVVSGDFLRLSQLALTYQFTNKQLKAWGVPVTTASVDFSMSNVFTIKSPQLKDQDPTQSGFSVNTTLSLRPSYTLGLRLTF